jgi:thiol-disulfide isomerase/thioredoxin
MKRSFVRSPYFWALLGVATVVTVAWVGRESYRPVITGTVAPEFEVTMVGAGDVALSDFEDRVVLINVWATWCGPCLQEMPSMQRLYEALSDEGFEILAVSVDAPFGESDVAGRPGGDLAAFAERLGLTFPILHNPSGDIQPADIVTALPLGCSAITTRRATTPTTTR